MPGLFMPIGIFFFEKENVFEYEMENVHINKTNCVSSCRFYMITYVHSGTIIWKHVTLINIFFYKRN